MTMRRNDLCITVQYPSSDGKTNVTARLVKKISDGTIDH